MEIVKEALDEKELEELSGGYAVVSDPIYKLTPSEEKVLSLAGYRINKTNKGNCRVTDRFNQTIDPKTLEGMCKVVKIADDQASKGKRGRTFWDFLMGD